MLSFPHKQLDQSVAYKTPPKPEFEILPSLSAERTDSGRGVLICLTTAEAGRYLPVDRIGHDQGGLAIVSDCSGKLEIGKNMCS
jgi:hypothetical protein